MNAGPYLTWGKMRHETDFISKFLKKIIKYKLQQGEQIKGGRQIIYQDNLPSELWVFLQKFLNCEFVNSQPGPRKVLISVVMYLTQQLQALYAQILIL